VKRGWISGCGATAKQLFATKAEALVQMKKIVAAGSRKYPLPLDIAALLQVQPVAS